MHVHICKRICIYICTHLPICVYEYVHIYRFDGERNANLFVSTFFLTLIGKLWWLAVW